MPTTLVPPFTPPIPRFTPANGQLVGPADGDPLLAASVNDPFYQIADRTTLAFNGLYGVYGSRMVASCMDAANIAINTQAAVRSSSGVLSGAMGSPIDIATVLGAAPLANTWYYLYGADAAGALTPIITVDPPEPTLKYRAGNADHMLISMFRTDGAAVVRNFTHYVGTYNYLDAVSALSAGTAAAPTAVPLPDVPFWALAAFLQLSLNNTAAGPEFAAYGYPGTTAAGGRNVLASSIQINPQVDIVPIDGQTSFEYYTSTATAELSVALLGFPL